jgi:hypothetical protein
MRKVLVFLVCILFGTALLAQNATTSVRGSVNDETGAALGGATITLTNVITQVTLTYTSGKSGEYIFDQLQPGNYKLAVSAPNFGIQQTQIHLLVSEPTTLNFKLKVGAATESVEVTATASLNFTDATIGNTMSNSEIQAAPIDSRNVADLLSLQPGVLYFGNNNSANNPAATTDSRLGAVAGARSDQGNITLDGIDDNDQTNGYAFTGVLRSTLDSTEEYRVTTTSSNADAGRSSGAQVTLVTKSGTNHFHGSAYEYWRNRYFAANDWFNKQAQIGGGLPNKPPQLTRNTFGGTIGGPILHDKLFFFFNYEGQRTREASPVTQEVPTDLYRAGTLQYQDSTKAVHALTPAQVATLDAPCVTNGVCPAGPGPDAAILAYFAQIPHANGLTVGDGLNEGSYAFSSAAPYSHNTSIIKLDWNPVSSQHVFVRGNLQKDVISGTEQFPGLPPSTATEDNTKGIAAGDTWTITPHMVNDIRYGYTRQGTGTSGLGSGSYTDVRFIAAPTAETRNTIRTVPLNQISDVLSYNKGRHNFQFGGNWRLIHNNSKTDANSWDSGTTNPQGLSTNGLPSPAQLGAAYPAVASSFASSYLNAYGNLVGAESSLTRNINYGVNPGGNTGSLLAQGAFVQRYFKSNEFEYYGQDSWRPTDKLTVTFGLRHTLLQVPYDTTGQSAAPTIDTDTFFKQRQIMASQGTVYEPTLLFAPNGPVYGRPGYWSKQKTNIAPRIAVAYAINEKTVLRGGFGVYYDHFGQGIINAFNQSGSFGLASKITSPLGQLGPEQAPRFTDRKTLPPLPVAPGAPTQTFPYAPPANNFSISWGVDNKLKTPYSEAFNLTLERSLPGGFTMQATYVGRLGRHLLQQSDLTTPVNFYDTKSGTSYFQAGAQLAAIVDQNGNSKTATVPTIAYFEDMFPYMANVQTKTCPNTGKTATAAIYCNEWTTYRSVLGETTALADIDFYCYGSVAYNCSASQSRFWQNQFSSLYAWTSNGAAVYNAGQFVLRHPYSHGFQMDLSYTLGNSIDQGSDAERANETLGGSGSYLTNSWIPAQSRAVSDFDTRHLISFNSSYTLPFGKGQPFVSQAGRMTNLLIGGWRVASIARWTSGLPFSIGEGGYTTDWEIGSYSVRVGPLAANTVKSAKNIPNAFVNASSVVSSTTTGGPYIRLPYPGEAGMRNAYRGDGYFDVDASLSKPFQITEKQNLRFTWEVFNVSNSVRFNTRNLTTNPTSSSFGNYSATLTTARRMQFSLRYAF